MSEVACRVLVGLFEAMDRRGLSVESIVAGSGYTRDALSDVARRIPWNDYAAMMRRLREQVGDETLVDLGGDLVHQPLFEAQWHALGLMLHPRHMVWASTKGPGNQMFTVIGGRYEKLTDERIRLELTIADGFDDCPAYFLLSKGTMTRGPELIGYPPARIELSLGPNRARYDMRFAPRPEVGPLERIRLVGRAALALPSSVSAAVGRQRELVDTLVELSRAKEALRRSEARLRAVIDSVPDYIITLDEQLRVTSVNRIDYGLREDQLLGSSILGWYDEHERDGAAQALTATLADGRPRTLQSEWTSPDGTRRNFAQVVGPIRGDDRVVGLVMAARENTAELRAEEERRALERRLARQERLDGLGLLAGGVAHDFNNLLSVVHGSVHLADQALGDGDDDLVRVALAAIREAAERATDITRQMLTYAGNVRGEAVALDVSAKVAGISHLMRTRLPARIELVVELAADLPAIEADPGALDQVVLNLLGNAVEAIGERAGRIAVRTGHRTERPTLSPEDVLVGDWPPGPVVYLAITDDGCGMTRDTQERIFDPFYSSKPDGHGLGLASVHGVVKSHGAAILLRSAPGKGTSFEVAFPTVERPPEARPRPEPAAEHRGRVLVVDDNAEVRDVAASLLTSAGYETVAAASGEDALEQVEGAPFHAVLLDLSMPGMGGAAACRRLAIRAPEAPVLIMSGHDRDGEGARLVQEGLARAFIQKPLRSKLLLDAVRSAVVPGARSPQGSSNDTMS